MKFSVITPTLNQAQFIEDTILSVLNQNYNNFEHIIIDGGSTDGTIEILKKYPHLKWISEKDSGQSNAINKGFRMATGDILSWINSDDFYEKNIFPEINRFFENNSNCHFLYGNITYIDVNKNELGKITGEDINIENLTNNPDIVRQPSSFWRRTIIEKVGYLDENLHLVMDYDYFIRIAKYFQFYFLNYNLSYYRLYSQGKSTKFKKQQLFELIKVLSREKKLIRIKTATYLLRKVYYILKPNV